MSLSLIGIIFVQGYYISNSISNKENNFNFTVKQALIHVSKKIEKEEYRDHVIKVRKLLEQGIEVNKDTTAIINLYIKQENQANNETLVYRNAILEENYKLSSALFDIGLDSTSIKKIINENETKIYKTSEIDGKKSSDALLSQIGKTEDIMYETHYENFAYRKPIHKRTSREEIDRLLKLKLLQDGIDVNYEFAIYSNDLATKVQTENFELENQNTLGFPIFSGDNGNSNYKLLVNFPQRDKFIWSSVLGMLGLSVLFTSIILIAFITALIQIMKQRQISEIKTDFINNMTHEFKTPIATINLALDSIKNPKIIDDKEKVARYLRMIREENKRMHAQVENLLRIS